MPNKKTVTINFISKDTTFGQIVNWALTIGKAIVFTSFTVVMGLFLYRFSLDRKIVYLQKKINDHVNEISSYSSIENDIRLYQDKFNGLEYLFSSANDSNYFLQAIESRLPKNTLLKNLSIHKNNISMQGSVTDEFSFVALLNSLKKEDVFADISVSEITSGGVSNSTIDFSINISTLNQTQK